MCTCKIRGKNKTREFKEGFTRDYIFYPCGTCPDCRKKKNDDMMLRIYAELQNYTEHGGTTAFFSLTYDNDHLPRYEYTHKDGTKQSFPCFSKTDKDAYIRKIGDYFRYYYGYSPVKYADDLPIKMFVACEYGKKRTHRSHLHVLLFIPRIILNLFGHNENEWKRILTQFWDDKGYVLFSPDFPLFVMDNGSFCAKYVSKYVSKQYEYYDQPDVQKYFNQAITDVKLSTGEAVIDKNYLKELRHEVRDFLPQVWKSPHFGATLEKYFDNLDSYLNGVDFHFPEEDKKGTPVIRKCPQYIERRMLMRHDNPTKSYKLTSKGKEWKYEKFKLDNINGSKRYEKLRSKKFLHMLLGEDFNINDNAVLLRFRNVDELYKYITSILVNSQVALELQIFNRVWYGLATPHFSDVIQLQKLGHENFVKLSFEYYRCSLYAPVDKYRDEGYFYEYDYDDDRLGKFYRFSMCPRFDGFLDALYVFDEIYNVYYRRLNKEHEKRNRQIYEARYERYKNHIPNVYKKVV